ncbi:MAG: hypothetical protein KDK07_20155 [Bauldia sp.]|nr:hypothetical protein [Bauldia sp.]
MSSGTGPAISGNGRGDFWAITTHFNPGRYASRLRNYRRFRSRLAMPLLAIEHAAGGRFELADDDADIVVRVGGGDVMWQKERLVNLALPALPASCTKVAWLDSDIVFDRPDWTHAASRLLNQRPLIQPFSHAFYMPHGWAPGDAVKAALDLRHPAAWLVAQGAAPEHAVAITGGASEPMQYTPGLAWAARRDFLAAHSLYDACIVGGGDGAMLRAAFGLPHLTRDFQKMQPGRYQHYLAWAEPFRQGLGGDGVGFIDGAVYHLWHGRPAQRRYIDRHAALAAHGYDPHTDIGLSPGGAWAWTSDKPALHAFVRNYFADRREDDG